MEKRKGNIITQIFTPEDSLIYQESLGPVVGTVKTMFWVSMAMVFTLLISGLQ
ncbi:hypothetical protein [Maridesulfovibrio bastinii]|uniref:hypothetical protein n=1 Tax=Maridesulfovibrio bastinii TaxID=47157 RepID=UPI0003FE0B25|nr:hypothetical protein [Maridesulfovibrio bastinii]